MKGPDCDLSAGQPPQLRDGALPGAAGRRLLVKLDLVNMAIPFDKDCITSENWQLQTSRGSKTIVLGPTKGETNFSRPQHSKYWGGQFQRDPSKTVSGTFQHRNNMITTFFTPEHVITKCE